MAAFSLLFFFSGASALLYQVVWQRMLSTIFGVTVYATSTVLAAFMGGLALGGLLGGRAADRMRRPLLLFAAAEAGIGLSAFATPWALQLTEQLYASLQGRAQLDFAGVTALRLLCSFLVLLVPTTLMGATLPAMAAALAARPAALRARLAALYGINTLGAFVGTLLAGYVLIGELGLRGTLRVAVAANLAVAAGGLLLALRARREPARVEADLDAPPARVPLTSRQGRVLLAAFAASGLVALGLEVVWFRMLLAYLPTTTYAFTTMLATVLAGIALGGLLAARRLPEGVELARLGVLLAAAGACSVVSANVLARTYAAGWRTSGLVQACIVALLPATTVMGMSYPRGLALWAASRQGIGFRVGAFSAFNLAGAILGSLLSGFVLVPAFGTRGALVTLSLIGLLAGLLLLRSEPAATGPRRGFALSALAFLLAAVTLPDPFTAARERRHRGESLLWSEESAQATVAVHRAQDGHRVLYIDGAHQANDSPEMRVVHQRIGLLPLLIHPAPRRALVIGLAGGATPGALALDSDVRVDVLELSSAVVRAAELFHELNGNVLRRGNVYLRVDDGRNHLLLTRDRYDILTADLIQPFHAGAGHLYSVEYFRLCRRALAPHGLMVQWIGHPPEEQYKLILRTFLEVFPETTLWAEAFLVGSTAPLRIDPAVFDRIRDEPELAAAVAAAGITNREALLGLYTAGPAALRKFAGSGEVLTDDRPLVEYYRSLGAARPVDLSKLDAAAPGELDNP